MRRPTAVRFSYLTVIAIFILAIAAFAVPLRSVNSGSLIVTRTSNDTKSDVGSKTSAFARWANLGSVESLAITSPAPVAETIATYSGDCVTPKSTFFLGETVCAKTDNVDTGELAATPGRWVDWILTGTANTIVSGSRTTTKITTNPQTFTYLPTSTGTYKVSITQDLNGQDDPQTPAVFTVVPEPPVSTYDAGCMSSKTNFILGETVCVKVNTDADSLAFVNPAILVESSVAITSNPQTATFTLPTATTQTRSVYTPPLTFDNRGTWQAFLKDKTGDIEHAVAFTVHDPQVSVADLQVSKSPVEGSTVVANGTLRVAIWVFNYGPDAAQSVQVNDSTPSNTTFQSLVQTSGPTFNCTTPAVGSAGVSQCLRSSLNSGEAAGFVATYQVNSSIANGTSLTSSATVSTTTTERTTDDNSGSTSATGSNPTPSSCALSCPGNITVTAQPGQTGANVTFSQPTTSGSCGAVSVSPASGSFFAIGTSVVTASTEGDQECTFLVTVNAGEDTEDPTISCPSNITVDETTSSANSATVSYNVTATDNSGSAAVTCDPVSGSSFAVGTHLVTCTATDAAGNSDTCTFSVTVNQVGCELDANSAAPTPKVASLPTITRACSVTLLAADDPTATDACGGTINGETLSDRTYDVPGTYTVTWTYTDSAGNTTSQNQSIVILPDNTAPVPDASSLPTVTGECTAAITGDPPTATDNCGGSGITGTPLDPLSYNTAGTYTVEWKFTDAAGNFTIQNQTVVVTDTHAPVVTLNGSASETIECHAGVYTDAGATANDNCSPAPTPTITSNNVNPGVPGTYTVVWTATDLGGNTATATRNVTVVDTTKPVITLNGASTMTVECHTAFTDPGASAADSCDTSVPVNVAGSVNADAVGTYTLTYSAADDSGNAATQMSRTVNVVDTTAPAVTLNGAATMTVILGSSFTDPGATANDSCTGSLAVSVSGSVNPNAIGTYTLTYSATDASMNTGTATRIVNVIYDFTGFFSPVANEPVFNEMKAGQSVPMKFGLNGNQGLGIVAANSPSSVQIACPGNPPINSVSEIETLAAGNSGLSYDSLSNQYKYVWKTENSWANTCRQFVLRLNDGTNHTASFKFK